LVSSQSFSHLISILGRRVIALNADSGALVFRSAPITGASAGTPVTSADGRYVFLTSNSESKTVGHFTILDTANATAATPIEPFFKNTNQTNPFSPVGVYHKPNEGYYDADGADVNTNDLVLWAFDTAGDAQEAGVGQLFVFQFPTLFQGTADELAVLPIGPDRDYQSSTAPVITNQGRSLYWGFSKASLRCWAGAPGVAQARFSRDATGTLGFDRGTPAYAGPYSSPALSTSSTSPMVFGGGPGGEFFMADYQLTEASLQTIPADTLGGAVKAPAIVSPDDQRVYYVSENGFLNQKRISDLNGTDVGWTLPLNSNVEGNMALTRDGTLLFVALNEGNIQAYRVAAVQR
jgi:hypothetical protein